MNNLAHSAPLLGSAAAEPTLDFFLQQIQSGRLAGVTLRTMANLDTPCEVLVPLKLATRIAQLLLDYSIRVQRQQEKQQAQWEKQQQREQAGGRMAVHAEAPCTYRPARRAEKPTGVRAIHFDFEFAVQEGSVPWLHPVHVYFTLDKVRLPVPGSVDVPKWYWCGRQQKVLLPTRHVRRSEAFTEQHIKQANAQLATLQSRVKVAYLSLPEDQRTAQNVHRRLTGTSDTTLSSHQHAA